MYAASAMSDAAQPSMSPSAALQVAIRELRRRRQAIQRRHGAADPRWAPTMAELAAALVVLEQLVRVIEAGQ
jgi:hypothetical protein